jgi:hypothetical protein
MAEAAKLPVKTERKLSEPPLQCTRGGLLKAFAARSIVCLMISAGFSGARHSVAHCSRWNHCGGPNCAGLPRRLST